MDIKIYGDPILKQNAIEVKDFNEDLILLADKMYELMLEKNGIGLAGPQVGKLLRIIIIDTQEENGIGRLNLINPQIIETYGNEITLDEGCLSVPAIYAPVTRPEIVKVGAQTLKGEEIEFIAKNLLARVIQHEIDHLNGILFVDKVKSEDKKLIKKDLKLLLKNQLAQVKPV